MSALRRAAIRRLASTAYEMDLDVFNGIIERTADGTWRIGQKTLDEWLAAHEGEEVFIIPATLKDERPMQVRTCLTCGRDHTDPECPYCRASRIRLRGR